MISMTTARRLAYVFIAAALTVPTPALADDDLEKDEEQQSGNSVETPVVMVTAARTEQDLNEVNMSVSVVDETELRRKPASNVADQLATVPGIVIRDMIGGSPSKRVDIRGMGTGRTLILVDGVKQSDQRSIDGSFFNIDPANIERIEVIKGPASVLYGSEAIGGVVNIITKKSRADDKPVSFAAGFTFDSSNESFSPRAAVFGSYNGFRYRLSGTGVDADDRDTPRGKIPYTSFDQREFAGNLGYDWDGGSIDFSFDEYRGSYYQTPTVSVGGGMYEPIDPWTTSRASGSLTETKKHERRAYNGKLVLNDLSDYLRKVTLTGYTQAVRRERPSVATLGNVRPLGAPVSLVDDAHNSYGGSIQSDWLLGSHFLIVGLDYDKNDFNAKDYSYSTTVPGLLSAVTSRAGYQETFDIFAQDEWSLTDNLVATLGLRYTSVDTGLTRFTQNPSATNSGKDSKTVGSVGLLYSGFENFYLRALFSQGYRNGNVMAKYMGSGVMLANPDLKPETSDNYEVGLRYDNGALNIDLALFYNDLTDGLSMQSVGGGNYQYINFDKVKVSGLELAVQYHIPGTGLTPYGSMSLLNYRTFNSNTKFKTNHNGKPSHWGTLGLKLEKDINDSTLFFADLNAIMSGGSHTENYSATVGHTSTQYRKPWQTANLSFGFEGETDSFKYNTSLSFKNIFDQDYIPISTGSWVPEPGFHVVWTAGIEF